MGKLKRILQQETSYYLLCFLLINAHVLKAQLRNGPMLGYKSMKEVAVWVQTDTISTIKFAYHPKGAPDKCIVKEAVSRTDNAYTLQFIADRLEVGSTYQYQLIDEDDQLLDSGHFQTQSLWQHRSNPPDFSFLIGSCTYVNEAKYDRPGEPYGKGLEIFSAMEKMPAEAMLWLGDNVYLREGDWDTKSGIYHRYTHFRSQETLQSFWKKFHHYAIWDDHDYGPNDADRSFVNKALSLEAFKDFWANPNYGFYNRDDCITGMFSYNDVDFFLLDNRSFRSPNDRKTGEREILGEEQLQWLIDALVSSRARFKIVAIGGQLLNPAAVYENHATYAAERKRILDLIAEEEIENVIFLSGDRHKTELSKWESENGIVIYDFTSSPLSSTSYNSIEEPNSLRVEGTHYGKQNFGMMNFKGSWEDRVLILQTYDQKGKLVWEHEIDAK